MKSLTRLERHTYSRRYPKAVDALLAVLDEGPLEAELATRATAAICAIAAAPGVALLPRQRIALLERRAAIRSAFVGSAYGSGAHLMRLIGLRADGGFGFERPEQIDKYMVFCPTADLEPSVVAALGRLPIDEATPLILSMLSDPPENRNQSWWLRVAALGVRLGTATIDLDLFPLATNAWNVEPDFITSMLHRSVLAMGFDDCENDAVGDVPSLVIAHDDDALRTVLKPHLSTLESRYAVTVLDRTTTVPRALDTIRNLAPDLLWLPKPGAAPWTCALAAVRCAPVQLAADHAPTSEDFEQALAFLVDASGREAA